MTEHESLAIDTEPRAGGLAAVFQKRLQLQRSTTGALCLPACLHPSVKFRPQLASAMLCSPYHLLSSIALKLRYILRFGVLKCVGMCTGAQSPYQNYIRVFKPHIPEHFKKKVCNSRIDKVDQLSQRDRAAGWVRLVMAKSGRLQELGDNIYRYCKFIFNHCDVFGQQNNRIRRQTQKGLLRRSRSFKVIEVSTSRKPVWTSYQ